MSSRIPDPPSADEAEGIPDDGINTPEQAAAGDEANSMEPAHDTAMAVDDFGTTAAEQHEGEGVDRRVSREEPEVLDAVAVPANEAEGADTPFDERAGQGVGRVVQPDEGVRSDRTSEMVGDDVGTDLGGYTAEESAMHVEPEA